MYVAPPPYHSEDPNYAIRLGLIGVLAYIAILVIDPSIPAIIASLPVGLVSANRGKFGISNAIAGPILFMILTFLISEALGFLRPVPGLYIGLVSLLYFFGFYSILRTGLSVGILVIIVTVLVSVMGMHGADILEVTRDGMFQGALVAMVIGPIAYMLVPTKTQKPQEQIPAPSQGNLALGALIRTGVLVVLSFWVYSVMEASDLMLVLIAAMVIVFPSKNAMLYEASQRIRATVYGGALALVMLLVFLLSPHLISLLGFIFLAGLWCGTKMFKSQENSGIYQYAFSVAMALLAGALSSQDPTYSTFTRVVLTCAGAIAAATAVCLFDVLTQWSKPELSDDSPTQPPQTPTKTPPSTPPDGDASQTKTPALQ